MHAENQAYILSCDWHISASSPHSYQNKRNSTRCWLDPLATERHAHALLCIVPGQWPACDGGENQSEPNSASWMPSRAQMPHMTNRNLTVTHLIHLWRFPYIAKEKVYSIEFLASGYAHSTLWAKVTPGIDQCWRILLVRNRELGKSLHSNAYDLPH